MESWAFTRAFSFPAAVGFFLVLGVALPKTPVVGTSSSWSESSGAKPRSGFFGLGGPVGFLALERLRPWERVLMIVGERGVFRAV